MMASYLVTVLVIELTPGPNMAVLAALTLAAGRRAGLAAVAGVALGLTVMGVAAAAGLAALVADNQVVWSALRWAGVAYLLYLAWETWCEAIETSPAGLSTPATGTSRNFAHGLVTNLLNPKAALFYVAIMPRFLPANGATFGDALRLTGLSVAIATLIHIGVVLLAARLHPVLSQPQRLKTTRQVLAIGLVAVALWFALNSAAAS